MADIFNIIATNYTTVGGMVPSKTPYAAVNAPDYQGTWKGRSFYRRELLPSRSPTSTAFAQRSATRAARRWKYQDVLIKDASFRIGDFKFMLAQLGKATIKTVMTNPYDGSTQLNTAYATRD